MPQRDDGGLGAQLVGDRITVNHRTVQVTKLLGEGGFSYVYLVKEISDASPGGQNGGETTQSSSNGASSSPTKNNPLVLKITSIHSRQQRSIAEKEAKLLSRLSHPSIIKMYDSSYRSAPSASEGLLAGIVGSKEKDNLLGGGSLSNKERSQHLILMEYCEGGHALDVCTQLAAAGQQFDLSSLIIAFGQICNAVSYLHAQRPPIVHRDLKPVNFLVKNGAYKLCDFGSAVFGHVELKTAQARAEAEEVIQKTTTQMFRAPEMVDLHMAKKLTQSTDVWALGCCLYSLAFLQNCFEEGSNLAILSRNYKIPENNPYGPGLVELIDRMLTVDPKARADMTEVILCLSALYSGKPLPKRKIPKAKKSVSGEITEASTGESEKQAERVGTFRTDGQGIRKSKQLEQKKPIEAKKLNPNSAAARRRKAASQSSSSEVPHGQNTKFPPSPLEKLQFQGSFKNKFDSLKSSPPSTVNQDLAFSTTDNPFADVKGEGSADSADDAILCSFHEPVEGGGDKSEEFFQSAAWEETPMTNTFPTFLPDQDSALMGNGANKRRGDGHGIEHLHLSTTDSDISPPKDKGRRRNKAK